MRTPTSRSGSEQSGKRAAYCWPRASTSKWVRSCRRNGDGTPRCSASSSGGSGFRSTLAKPLAALATVAESAACPATRTGRKSSTQLLQRCCQRRTRPRRRCRGMLVATSVIDRAARPRRVFASPPGSRRVVPRRYSSAPLRSAQARRYMFVVTSPACQPSGTVSSRPISPRRRSIASRTVGYGFRHQPYPS